MVKRDSQDQDHKRDGDCPETPCQFSQFFSPMHIASLGDVPPTVLLSGYRSSGAIFLYRGNHRYETHAQMCGRRRKIPKPRCERMPVQPANMRSPTTVPPRWRLKNVALVIADDRRETGEIVLKSRAACRCAGLYHFAHATAG
jgi:hypothetical protein